MRRYRDRVEEIVMKSIGAALLLLAMAPGAPEEAPSSHAAPAHERVEMAQADLADSRIARLLVGNSIVHQNFGCAFYRPDGTMVQYSRSGESREGKWRVRDDVYYSSGQCGRSGCWLTGYFPNLVFKRLDGAYEQPVIVILGNYCEKNGLFS